jgi:hypothetical protein
VRAERPRMRRSPLENVLGLSPTVAPEHLWVCHLRLPQMLEPTDRTFFPPGLANAFRGAASADPRV